MIRLFLLFAFFHGLVGAEPFTDADWQRVLSGEHRSLSNKARDQYRHPQETIAFWGVQTNSVVIEIWPGSGWYTELLAPLLDSKDKLGRKGKLYAAHFSEQDTVPYFKRSRLAFNNKVSSSKSLYKNMTVTTLMPPEVTKLAPVSSADFVLTFRNVHNWMKMNTADEVFNAMYAALKPGGVLGVVEHRAKVGTPVKTMITSGYVTEAYVKQLASQAGFTFVSSSEINSNDKDLTDHPKGVWSLPPSLRGGDKDKAKFLAIGESDRMTLKFKKPLND